MKFKRSLTLLGMSAVAVLTSLTLATAASAADLTIYTTDDNPGGRLEFTAYGDHVRVCDVQADGKRAVGYVIRSGSIVYRLSASGNGTCTEKGASNGTPYNLSEGALYTFRVCLDMDNNNTSDDVFCRSVGMTA